jgi:peptidoglycan/LPS O-acetylase OafA/YrhL
VRDSWNQRLAGSNAFDAVRLVLASLVIFEHSFFLVDNGPAREPLYVLSHGQMHFGSVAVFMFFAVSGFLIARSRLDSSLGDYLLKRILRIGPGFWCASFLGLLVIGPWMADGAYWGMQNWPALIATALSLKQANPADVLSTNPLHLVHGTLWTIRYEFDCYLAIALLGTFGLLAGRKAIVAFVIMAGALAAAKAYSLPAIDHGLGFFLISSPDRWGDMFPFFLVGSAFFIWRDKIPKSPVLLALSLVALAAGVQFGGLYWALLFGGSYAALYAAMSFSFAPRIAGRRVDLSYGLYLYGWPTQQVLLHFFHLSPLALFAASLPTTAAIAYLSWTFVEAPALSLIRRKVRRAVPALPQASQPAA